jgi:hypothetical protein
MRRRVRPVLYCIDAFIPRCGFVRLLMSFARARLHFLRARVCVCMCVCMCVCVRVCACVCACSRRTTKAAGPPARAAAAAPAAPAGRPAGDIPTGVSPISARRAGPTFTGPGCAGPVWAGPGRTGPGAGAYRTALASAWVQRLCVLGVASASRRGPVLFRLFDGGACEAL